MLTYSDLVMIRDRAARRYTGTAPRTRLEGMTHDLTDADLRLLAIYEASVTHANSKLTEKRLDDGELDAIFPKTYQRIQETIEGQETQFNLKSGE